MVGSLNVKTAKIQDSHKPNFPLPFCLGLGNLFGVYHHYKKKNFPYTVHFIEIQP